MEEKEKIDLQNSIEIRSEEVQEILGKTPSGILRWGITVLLLVVIGIMTGSWFFKYPDIITAPITITTENVPVQIAAKTNGKITELLIKDNEQVKPDQILAVIENPANYKQILQLKDYLANFNIQEITNSDSLYNDTILYTPNLMLGDIQPTFNEFLKSLNAYSNFTVLNFHEKKIQAIKEQMRLTQSYYYQICSQNKLLENDMNLTQQQYNRDSAIYNGKVISKADFEKSESNLIQKKYSIKSTQTTLIQTKIQLTQLQQSILDLQLQYQEQKKSFEDALSQANNTLKNQIHNWEQTYLLISPIAGTVSFTKFWAVHQNVSAGDKVLTVIPLEPSKMIGKVSLPVAGSGKVKQGQKANIKLDNYPYQEYGTIQGIVQNKSLMANDSKESKEYSVEIILPQNLKTNYNKILEFSQDMSGTAEIITENVRLLERFFNPIKSIFKEKFKN